MMRGRGYVRLAVLAISALILSWVSPGASAQSVLPQPQSPFQGKIGRTAKDSKPDFPKGVEAPKAAPAEKAAPKTAAAG